MKINIINNIFFFTDHDKRTPNTSEACKRKLFDDIILSDGIVVYNDNFIDIIDLQDKYIIKSKFYIDTIKPPYNGHSI